ncbi:MAG TPA: SWIM zinc finger family protein [Streptosporangiaceae bacterium]|nr:SWIM zinc finger family protein [Streptosporangiaceae bacterium]
MSERTWWGHAWLEALEQRARLDPDRLPRGRDYARDGAVGALTLGPGEARAEVQGRKTEPYRVRVRVRQFTDDEWGRVLEAISARLGHAAALLDGDLPPEIAEDAASTGLDLLPGGGEIGPRCDCPDDADPCKHSAAVCYLIADVLDADPFALFLLRGRTRDQVLAGVRARRRESAPAAAGPGEHRNESAPRAARPADPGVDARTAYRVAADARPGYRDAADAPTVPAPPLPPSRPGRPAALPVDPPPWRAGLRDDLAELAADAAQRAWELAVGLSADAGLGLDPGADLARRAARALGTPSFAVLAERTGIAERDLARQALAWKHGGAAGLELLTSDWDPAEEVTGSAALLATAQYALHAKTGVPPVRSGNRITAGRLQLRVSRDLRWFPYTRAGVDWEPSGEPATDPRAAISAL